MRQKSLAHLLISGIIFVAFTAIVAAEAVKSDFDASEKRNSEVRAKVLGAAVATDLERLAALAMSYGYWDDLRKFVLSKKTLDFIPLRQPWLKGPDGVATRRPRGGHRNASHHR
jgi:sensor domain CHASE-containing protein